MQSVARAEANASRAGFTKTTSATAVQLFALSRVQREGPVLMRLPLPAARNSASNSRPLHSPYRQTHECVRPKLTQRIPPGQLPPQWGNTPPHGSNVVVVGRCGLVVVVLVEVVVVGAAVVLVVVVAVVVGAAVVVLVDVLVLLDVVVVDVLVVVGRIVVVVVDIVVLVVVVGGAVLVVVEVVVVVGA